MILETLCTRKYLNNCLLGLLVLIGCSWPSILSGQSDVFNKRYEEVYLNIIAADVNEALRITDSLVSVASTDEQQMKALMLLANIYSSLGDIPTASIQVLSAQKIANKGKHAEWQARTSGFLASTFRSVGLLEESKKHLKQADAANEKQKTASGYFLTKVNILQEKAFHAKEDSLFDIALDYLKEGDTFIKQDTSNQARAILITATNDQLKAICYLHLEEYKLADSLLKSSLRKLQGEESNLRSYIYRAQAELALKQEQYDSAYHYLQLAQPYIISSQREELKLLLYGSYIRYYQAVSDHENAVYYNELYQDVARSRERKARKISNELVQKLNQDKQRYERNVRYGWTLFFSIVGLMSVVLVYVFIKRHHEKKAYLKLIASLKDEQHARMVAHQRAAFTKKATVEDNTSKELLISADTESRLLSELEALEETAFFLDKDISLASLSTRLSTNQRYASFIIRKHRDMDFNSYIQHYRIHYIMNRTKLEPDLLDYKLSYLADLAGFSSHSKFSAVFKSVTGIPPSVFIHYTKEELGK